MGERQLSEVESTIDDDVARQIEQLHDAYEAVEAAAEDAGQLDRLESYLAVDIVHIVEHLKRARQWEHQLEAHQRGLFDHAQVLDRVGDDVFTIRAQVNRTERDLADFVETLETTRASLDDGRLTARLDDLLDGLEHQRQQLAALLETLEAVDTDLQNAGFTWID
ncbi:hypothetical protein [Haloglomus litoreum]|uniref:hypothetical protein n=1 Tax=Haloglomus litoreum TaxID=3034026 RepID=UPI0023E7D2D6|nr:hypothetical protein [Haloglomus sp. DT116]